ncbi:MAG: IS5 family transposase [Muribaculaceae bacterium]|nr:IS5 family transposase [Muribaculaceae bacterium]
MTLTQRNFILDNFPEIFKTKSKADIFDIINALFFLIKTGCQWRLLPNDFPRWRTVYEFYRKWLSTGFFDRLTQELNALARASQGKSPQPTVAVIDSQSVRTGLAQSVKGVDGGKKIKGIRRQLAVDSNGFPLAIVTSAANVHDSKGGVGLITETLCNYPAIRQLKADNGYCGSLVEHLKECPGVEFPYLSVA